MAYLQTWKSWTFLSCFFPGLGFNSSISSGFLRVVSFLANENLVLKLSGASQLFKKNFLFVNISKFL